MNAEHQEKMEFLRTKGNKLINTMNTCYIYEVGIDMYSPPSLHPSFIKAMRMTKTESAGDLAMFVAQYGTHFFKSIRMGYRTGMDLIMSETQSVNVESVLNSFDMMVSAPFVSAAASVEKAQDYHKAILNKSTKTYEYTVGQQPNEGGHTPSYAPLTYKLVPLTSIPGLQEHDKLKLTQIYMRYTNKTPKH